MHDRAINNRIADDRNKCSLISSSTELYILPTCQFALAYSLVWLCPNIACPLVTKVKYPCIIIDDDDDDDNNDDDDNDG